MKDIHLESNSITLSKKIAFIELTMGLKIKGVESLYYGTTRLIYDKNGKVKKHRDYFDFCSGTFVNLTVVGNFFR